MPTCSIRHLQVWLDILPETRTLNPNPKNPSPKNPITISDSKFRYLKLLRVIRV